MTLDLHVLLTTCSLAAGSCEAAGCLGRPGEPGWGWAGGSAGALAQWTRVCGAHSDADVLPLSPGGRLGAVPLRGRRGGGAAVHQDVVPLLQGPAGLDGEENQLG